MSEKGPYILVTGGAGYVGAHTNRLLVDRGYATVVYDNLVYGHEDHVPEGSVLIRGDLGDEAKLADVFARYPIAAVMHFASYTYVGESVTNPERYYHHNLVGALNLLGVMRRRDVSRIIFSSSAAVYGKPASVPIPETATRAPINPYGRTKLVVEMMLEDYARAYGLSYVALRYFNASGAHASGAIGEDHDPETHLIPNALNAVMGRSPAMRVFGDDYATADGTCLRDYIHVSDLASAHLLALEHLSRGGASDVFNVGLGRGFTVKQVLAAVERVTGKPVPAEIGPRREGDPDALVADARHIRAVLGWEPERDSIDAIVADAWRFHQRRFG
jgi:UDP-glucose 4-epimerase